MRFKATILINMASFLVLGATLGCGHFFGTLKVQAVLTHIDRAGGFNHENLRTIAQGNLIQVRGEEMADYLCRPWIDVGNALATIGMLVAVVNIAIHWSLTKPKPVEPNQTRASNQDS